MTQTTTTLVYELFDLESEKVVDSGRVAGSSVRTFRLPVRRDALLYIHL